MILRAIIPARLRRQSRAGVSIIEVVFAILITSIGLLGAIALFPVALAQARKGLQYDAAAAAGLSAVHTFDVYGMRQPARWRYFDNSGAAQTIDSHTELHPAHDPSYVRMLDGRHAFCIDPRFIADNISNTSTANQWRVFPSGGGTTMTRVTFLSGVNNPAFLNKIAADRLFQFEDDLAYERPADRTLDAVQLYSPNTEKRRQYEGRLSWFATLAPKVERMQQQFDDRFILSIVVCQDRAANLDVTGLASEWTVSITAANFHSAGQGGGDVTLSTGAAGRLDSLKAGDWVMLGRMINTPFGNVPLFRWYRLVSVDPEVVGSGPYTREATLAGQDWDVGPNGTITEVTIVPTVVTVYEKTVRLDY